MEDKIKVLFGSCGGLTGLYLSKLMSKDNKYDRFSLIGFDADSQCASKKYIKRILKAPSLADEENFLLFLEKVIIDEEISIYIPLLSKEIKLIAKNKKRLEKNTNVSFVISPYRSLDILENKGKAYEELNKIGIDVPEVFEEDVRVPLFMKPEIGSGSRNSFSIDTVEEYVFYRNKYKNNIFMEKLVGNEYTVDCIFDKNGKLITYNQRLRKKTNGGAVTVTQNDFSIDLIGIILKISNSIAIYGPANFQFICNENRKTLIDINLRFPSGGLPLTIESGADFLEILLKMNLDEEIEMEKYQSDRKKRTMYRYYEEFFEED